MEFQHLYDVLADKVLGWASVSLAGTWPECEEEIGMFSEDLGSFSYGCQDKRSLVLGCRDGLVRGFVLKRHYRLTHSG